MSNVQISKNTINVLKNFISINKSIVINPGNKITTMSVNKTIIAYAEVEEDFTKQIPIYDLGFVINGLALFENPVFDLSKEKCLIIRDSNSKSHTEIFYADPEIIQKAPDQIRFPSTYCKFRLSYNDIAKLQRAASIYQVKDLCFYSDGTGSIVASVRDKENDTSNAFSVIVGEDDREFCFCMKMENLRVMAAEKSPLFYEVEISDANAAKFVDSKSKLEYFIALEPN